MATTFRISRNLLRATPRVAARMLRLVMVLSLWHAPIPWIHVHELEGPQVERLGALSQHIAEFHARELMREGARLDWHSHLVLPWCMTHEHDCPADDEQNPASDDIFGGAKVVTSGLAACQTIGQPTTRAFLAVDVPADAAPFVHLGAGTSAALFGPAQCRHFFETYGCSVAVRDLVSVRLC
jgi:hypothetical protein